MRHLMSVVLVVLALGSCGGDDDGPVASDAGEDAATDSAVDGATANQLDGRWRLTWSCTSGCDGAPIRPALTYSGLLDVAGGALAYSDAHCADCAATHQGLVAADRCVDVAGAVEPTLTRDAYRLCLVGGTATTTVRWVGRFGPPGAATSWRLASSR